MRHMLPASGDLPSRLVVVGAHNRTRTDDLALTKGVLYQLSYVGTPYARAGFPDLGVSNAWRQLSLVEGAGFEPA